MYRGLGNGENDGYLINTEPQLSLAPKSDVVSDQDCSSFWSFMSPNAENLPTSR